MGTLVLDRFNLQSRSSELLVLLIVFGLVAVLLAVPLAPPADARTAFFCLASLAGTGRVVVKIITSSAGAAGLAVDLAIGVIGVIGSCRSTNPYWWGNFPLYVYSAGSGGHLNQVM
jgi:hypothetical protein